MSSPPLWAPWRMAYVLGPKAKGACVFCFDGDLAESDAADPEGIAQERARVVVCSRPHTLVIMNLYPFAAGHVMVIPRRHVSDLAELGDAEHADLFHVVRETTIRLKAAVRAEGLNVGINLGAAAGAGIAAHLHVHVVPRWNGDTNFMPVTADTRVIPQALDETRSYLAGAFEDLNLSLAPTDQEPR